MLTLLMLISSLLFASPSQQSDAYPYMGSAACDQVADAYNAQIDPWIGYPEGWNQPDDLQWHDRIHLEGESEVWVFHAYSGPGWEWIWYLIDQQITAAPDGTHEWFHHGCMLKRQIFPGQVVIDWTENTFWAIYREVWFWRYIH